ncbi:class I SAM-dependent methyltransferase [Candidatus Saccharibacteria bacterium]|nr:class I SAM-dependent methyltransferase [Candidatus Saccharibacteria bacterium]
MTKFVEETYRKIANAYTREFFDDVSDTPMIDNLLERLAIKSTVLDIGCGPGQFSQYLMGHGHKVTGIDTSDEMLAIARDKVPTGTFTKMDMRKLVYPDETFDACLVAYSLIHIPSSELLTTLREIIRVMKVGGIALFIVQKGDADQILDEPLAEGEKIFVNFFSEDRFKKFLVDGGFDIIEMGTMEQSNEDVLSTTVLFSIVQKKK